MVTYSRIYEGDIQEQSTIFNSLTHSFFPSTRSFFSVGFHPRKDQKNIIMSIALFTVVTEDLAVDHKWTLRLPRSDF